MDQSNMDRFGVKAYFLCGPTAVGKTAWAHRLALDAGYDIVSADAMLVYRGMDIGTAKPTARERDEVRYFGLDLAEPDQAFSVADYLAATAAQLRTADPPPSRPLLVAGGTGLYLNALIHGLAGGPPPEAGRRREWEALARAEGVAALREELRRRAPAWLEGMPDTQNPRRLIRALEWSAAGITAPPRTWQRQPPRLSGLSMSPIALSERIAVRVHAMVRAGLWSETARLLKHPGLGKTARQAIGYAEAQAYLAGGISEDEAIERIVIRTRRLAKRQMTWLRHQLPMEWIALDTPRPDHEIMASIRATWTRHGPCHVSGLDGGGTPRTY